MSTLPVLYTFRRCPYAIRARLALAVSGVEYAHEEVQLKDKPQAMLTASPKGTVPVLVLRDGQVLDESLDIMLWALQQNDPEHWLSNGSVSETTTTSREGLALIHATESEFKPWLDRYKYFDRFPEESKQAYRKKAEVFIIRLEAVLAKKEFLNGDLVGLTDMAIAPFVRQFAHVDKQWFFETDYKRVISWLNCFLQSERFQSIMQKQT